MTANPTILARCIERSNDYDGQFSSLVADGCSVVDAFWELVVSDIVDALAVLRPVSDSSGGGDGFVSLEVAPELAHDSEATVLAARALEAAGSEEAAALRGRAAVAQAKLAYQLFTERFSGPRWQALARHGAHRQRPLWASTSTKNPAYRDTLHVDSLIGPGTVNTLPEATIAAFEDHGTLARTIDTYVEEAAEVMRRLGAVGVDMDDVGMTLEDEGVAAFHRSFQGVLAALARQDPRSCAGMTSALRRSVVEELIANGRLLRRCARSDDREWQVNSARRRRHRILWCATSVPSG